MALAYLSFNRPRYQERNTLLLATALPALRRGPDVSGWNICAESPSSRYAITREPNQSAVRLVRVVEFSVVTSLADLSRNVCVTMFGRTSSGQGRMVVSYS